jgi:hypothetical protein
MEEECLYGTCIKVTKKGNDLELQPIECDKDKPIKFNDKEISGKEFDSTFDNWLKDTLVNGGNVDFKLPVRIKKK